MNKQNWPAVISLCLAFGGIVTVIVICFLIGFGLHSAVGKDALYVAFALQVINLIVMKYMENRPAQGKKHHTPSKKMRKFRLIVFLIWASGALLLSASLLLVFCGLHMTNAWVRYTCIAGAILSPIGWIGLLMAAHRQHQATLVVNS